MDNGDDEICYCGQRIAPGDVRCSFCDADLRVVRRLRAQERAMHDVRISQFGTIHGGNSGCATGCWNALVIFGWVQIIGAAVLLGLLILVVLVVVVLNL